MEELFDVVDVDDWVIDTLPRSEVHRRKLLHRAVHVFVFNTRGELLVHQRSATKDEQPLMWNSSCSGHVSAGEAYDLTAVRELEEELGLRVPIQFIEKFRASPDLAHEQTRLYQATTDLPPVFDPGEIAQGRFLSLGEIRTWLTREPVVFSTPFAVLFAWYYERYGGVPAELQNSPWIVGDVGGVAE